MGPHPHARSATRSARAALGLRALPDYLAPSLDLVLVGINPGLRSAEKGHHFAGPGNKFWNLLFESGLVPQRMSYEEDFRLPQHGIGLTNIVARPSRSSADLSRPDFERGRSSLLRKIQKYRPRVAAFVGVTVFRELWPAFRIGPPPKRDPMRSSRRNDRRDGPLRPSESERPKRPLHVRRDAVRVAGSRSLCEAARGK